MKQTLFCALLLSLLSCIDAFAQGTILWDESVNGSLSHDFSNPTSLSPLGIGTNSIIGTTEITPVGSMWVTSPDIFLLNVQPNSAIRGIYLQIDKPNVWTGLKDPTFTTDLAFSGNSSNGELLSQWGIGPVGQGQYGMYLLNNDAQPAVSIANYRLDFLVQAIPEPSTLALVLLGMAVLVGWRRKK